jgi:hypothetical protein
MGALMLFVWTGRGFWGLLLPILFCIVLGMVLTPLLGENFVYANGWIFGFAVFAAAIANWAFGRRWNGTASLRPWDIRGILMRRRRMEHTIFSAPMELWSIVLVVVGVWVILVNLPSLHH